jgi:hypothetical protein
VVQVNDSQQRALNAVQAPRLRHPSSSAYTSIRISPGEMMLAQADRPGDALPLTIRNSRCGE